MARIKTETGIKSKVRFFLAKVLGVKIRSNIIAICGLIRFPLYKVRMAQEIKKLSIESVKEKRLTESDAKTWRRMFNKLILLSYQKRFTQHPRAFFNAELQCLKTIDIPAEEPIVICAVKNDLLRIRHIMEHYRKLDVKYFVFIDNGSTDGTKEFLLSQADVILYKVDHKYNSTQKTMWINRVMTLVGMDRWYLVIDSDECFVFPHYEEISLKKYIQVLEEKKIYVIKSLMLELYPDYDLFCEETNSENFIEDYCWFDKDSDEYIYNPDQNDIVGGLHNRLFGVDFALRTKANLFKMTRNRFMISSHEIFPQYEYVNANFGAVILHYKFLRDDLPRIEKAVQEGTYVHGSLVYKHYQQVFKDKSKRNLFFSGSVKWEGTKSFSEFWYIKDMVELDS